MSACPASIMTPATSAFVRLVSSIQTRVCKKSSFSKLFYREFWIFSKNQGNFQHLLKKNNFKKLYVFQSLMLTVVLQVYRAASTLTNAPLAVIYVMIIWHVKMSTAIFGGSLAIITRTIGRTDVNVMQRATMQMEIPVRESATFRAYMLWAR